VAAAAPRVLFRPDGGARAGLGHVGRCLSLAAAVRAAGGRPRFVTEADAVDRVRAAGFDAAVAEPAPGDPLGVLGAPAEAVLVDSYRLTPPYLERLYAGTARLALVDDLGELYAPADLVVNGAAHAGTLGYDPAEAGVLLLGPRYMLLGPEYAGAPARAAPEHPRQVLVAMGGGDPLGIMARVLEEVRAALGPGPELHAIVGPYFGPEWAPGGAAARAAEGVHLHRAPADLRPHVARADLAVTAAGITLYELAACGVPTVAFSIAPNQRPQLEVLAGEGALASAGDASSPGFPQALRAAVRRLAPAEARSALGRAAHAVVDGGGASRVAACLLALCAAPRPPAPSRTLLARECSR
jgi:spore coat polysaccharide biosynthesis predicted glycosyltransferase SpsG